MKNYLFTLMFIIVFIPFESFACSPLSLAAQKERDSKFASIFIAKISEREVYSDTIGRVEKIRLRFIPVKVRKGDVSLEEDFWLTQNLDKWNFNKGEFASIYADKNNKIVIGDWCYSLSGSLGVISTDWIDEDVIYWKLDNAIQSDSRAELKWAKKRIKDLLKDITHEKERKYWITQIELIEERLIKVY